MSGKAHCSFCGKSQDEVIKLIAGPQVFICDECVALCAAICIAEPIEGKKFGRYYVSTDPPLDVDAIADRIAEKLKS